MNENVNSGNASVMSLDTLDPLNSLCTLPRELLGLVLAGLDCRSIVYLSHACRSLRVVLGMVREVGCEGEAVPARVLGLFVGIRRVRGVVTIRPNFGKIQGWCERLEGPVSFRLQPYHWCSSFESWNRLFSIRKIFECIAYRALRCSENVEIFYFFDDRKRMEPMKHIYSYTRSNNDNFLSSLGLTIPLDYGVCREDLDPTPLCPLYISSVSITCDPMEEGGSLSRVTEKFLRRLRDMGNNIAMLTLRNPSAIHDLPPSALPNLRTLRQGFEAEEGEFGGPSAMVDTKSVASLFKDPIYTVTHVEGIRVVCSHGPYRGLPHLLNKPVRSFCNTFNKMYPMIETGDITLVWHCDESTFINTSSWSKALSSLGINEGPAILRTFLTSHPLMTITLEFIVESNFTYLPHLHRVSVNSW